MFAALREGFKDIQTIRSKKNVGLTMLLWHFKTKPEKKNSTEMGCFARVGTICTILKTWKTSMVECHS